MWYRHDARHRRVDDAQGRSYAGAAAIREARRHGSDVSPSEIAFLAVGLVFGSAIGGAIMEAIRSRPAPRREVRLTIAPNSIHPRPGVTLANAERSDAHAPIPGSPEDGAWPDLLAHPASETGHSAVAPQPMVPRRTPVPSGPVGVSDAAVAIPVDRPAAVPVRRDAGEASDPRPGPSDRSSAIAGRLGSYGAVTMLDPTSPSRRPGAAASAGGRAPSVSRPGETTRPGPDPAPGSAGEVLRKVLAGAAEPEPDRVRARPPAERPPVRVSSAAVGVVTGEARPTPAPTTPPAALSASSRAGAELARAAAELARATASSDAGGLEPGPVAGGTPDAGSAVDADPCDSLRMLVQERCAVATTAREQARVAADALRDAQRAYDDLRERVEQTQALIDPREVVAEKEALHRGFRAATAGAANAEATEQAAREWLNQINALNARTREGGRVVESGSAQLRDALPRLERLTVEADAARIGAEGAEVACREAREALARCEEPQAEAAAAAVAAGSGKPPWAAAQSWPASVAPPPEPTPTEPIDAGDQPVIVRVLGGDRGARESLVAAMAGDDAELGREWQIRLAQLVDAISARAIEDGYLDLPDDDPFWGLFPDRERREIVGALSALGFRFDGMGGFADDRVPATRDLSLAVGYAGLDRMRIRAWPHENELAGLYAHASVAAAEWLAHEAGDLSLGEMVDALGGRASDLADLWNAWGRLRPSLLAVG